MNKQRDTETDKFHLFFACQEGDLEAFDKLMTRGVDPNMLDESTFDRPIHVAVANGSVDIVRRLLDDPRVDPALAGAGWLQPLEIAETLNYPKILALFRERGINRDFDRSQIGTSSQAGSTQVPTLG